MKIDKKRIAQLVAIFFTLIILAMSIPQAVDSHRRNKEEQALLLKERTLQFSTPATTEEQKAILQAILPTYKLFMPWPKNGEESKPTYPSEDNSLVLVEEVPYCSMSLDELRIRLNSSMIFEKRDCVEFSNLLYFLDYDENFTVLIPDLLKANKSPWMNPNPILKGIYLWTENGNNTETLQKSGCAFEKECWNKFSKKFKNTRAYMRMTRAVISTDKKSALIYIEFHTWMFSYGYLQNLKYIDGHWVLDESRRIYIT
jgi:hypothetical protein